MSAADVKAARELEVEAECYVKDHSIPAENLDNWLEYQLARLLLKMGRRTGRWKITATIERKS